MPTSVIPVILRYVAWSILTFSSRENVLKNVFSCFFIIGYTCFLMFLILASMFFTTMRRDNTLTVLMIRLKNEL